MRVAIAQGILLYTLRDTGLAAEKQSHWPKKEKHPEITELLYFTRKKNCVLRP